MYDVTGLGELLIDFAPQGSTDQGFPILAANPGGAPPNYLAALASYGVKTRFVGKVGDDSLGKMLKEAMSSRGIDTSGVIIDNSVFTTLAFVTLDSTGDRNFSFARKPGADTCLKKEELPEDIGNTRIFHHGTLSMTHEPARSATLAAISAAKEKGALISLDPNLRMSLWENEESAKEQMLSAISLADIVKISEEEVEFLFGCGIKEGASKLHSMGVRLAFITMGPKGCTFSKSDGTYGYIDGVKGLKTVDTTGAGDIFGGSAAYGILKAGCDIDALGKSDLEEIVRFANAAAALSTTKFGGLPSVPTLEEAQKLAREYYI